MPNNYHLNMSYANIENVMQPSYGFNYKRVDHKYSLDNLMSTFVANTSARFEKNKSMLNNIETHMENIGATIKYLETHIGQIVSSITK